MNIYKSFQLGYSRNKKIIFLSLIIISLLIIVGFKLNYQNVNAADGDITAPVFNFTQSHSGALVPNIYTYEFSVTDSESNIAMIDYTIDETVPRLSRKIYIDNVLAGESNPGDLLNVSSSNFAIGQTNGSEELEGLIDEVRVYNRSLNPYEIAQLFNYPDNIANPVPLNGLVGYWNMDEASYNGTPGEVLDTSGSGMNGTANGNATTAAGKLGNALTLDGSGDFVQITDGSSLPIGNSFYTMSAWINPTFMGVRGILGWGNYGYDSEVNALILDDDGLTNYWWSNDMHVTAPGSDLTGAWHHVVATYGYHREAIVADDTAFDELSETGSFDLDLADFNDGESHTIKFYVTDIEGNVSSQSFNFSYYLDSTAPTINFTQSPDGLTGVEFTIAGTATDTDNNIAWVNFRIDDGSNQTIFASDGDYDSQSELFEVDLNASSNFQNITDGAHTIYIIVRDILDNERVYNFPITMDRSSPTCNFVNKPTPYYSNTGTYSNISCTDNNQITSAKYWVYHAVLGTVINDTQILPIDGIFNEATEEFTYTFTLNPNEDLDGPVEIGFRVYDQVGNYNPDFDPVVIEYVDDSAPSIKIDRVTPDPITDTTPKITGSCSDNTQYDTNSYIKLIEYRIGAGVWSEIESLDGAYNDDYSESFAIELPEQTPGTYTVTIRCTDYTDHITTDSDTFEIIEIDENGTPGNFEHTDSFDTHTFQDIPNTTLIWGNDRLRLKEDITFSRTAIDTTGFPGRYDDIRSEFTIVEDPQDANILWYTKSNKIFSYNIQSNTTQAINMMDVFGIANFEEIHSLHLNMYQNKKYMWISDAYNLTVYNMTDNEKVSIAISGGAYSVDPDVSRGRLAAYLITGNAPGGFTNFIYYDLNDSLTNTGDDSIMRPAIDAAFDTTTASRIQRNKTGNNVFISYYTGGKIHKFNDNNTPSNTADDQLITYESYPSIFGFTFDPANRLIFGTSNNSNGEVFVVTDDGGTEFDSSDDTITKIANSRQLGFRNIYGIQYIEGENNVGDQLLLTTENHDPIYMNFNDTYTDLLDDTFIDLPFRNGSRPGTVFTYIRDYNTFYVNIDTQGLFRVNLNRGWEDSGEAIGVPQRPSQKLILDNFIANAGQIDNISANTIEQPGILQQIQDLFIPKVSAQQNGVNYYISNDDGLSWHLITLGQLQQLNPHDYRVKFKIVMSEQNGQSPALENYTLAFAGYTTPEQSNAVVGYSAVVEPSSVLVNSNFNLTLTALDSLGYKVGASNNNLTLSLLDQSNNVVIDILNKSSAVLVNGTVTLTDVQLNKSGVYRIRASDGTLSAVSNLVSVNSSTTPSLNFYASKYKVNKGEEITLYWNSANITNITIEPSIGAVGTSGSRQVLINEKTIFRIFGSGDNGNLSTSFTVDLNDDLEISSYPISGMVDKLMINSSEDQEVLQGTTVKIWWEIEGNPDYVYIDYLGREVSSSGDFEFVANNDTSIIIRATKDDQIAEKIVQIRILKLPGGLENNALVAEILRISAQYKDLPQISLILFTILQVVLIALLLINMISSAGTIKLGLATLANILIVTGIIPFKNRRGYVYESRSMNHIPFTTVNVIDQSNSNIIATLITDLKGAYYEPFISKGKYIFEALRSGFVFPTVNKRPAHLGVLDFYKGEPFEVGSEKEKQAIIIPMDNELLLSKPPLRDYLSISIARLLVLLKWTIYPLFVLSLIVVLLFPNPINIAVALIYIILFALRVIKLLKRPTMRGSIIARETGLGINGAVIQLKNRNRELVAITRTNKNGEYAIYAPRDRYSVQIHSDDYMLNSEFGSALEVDLGDNSGNGYDYTLGKISS